MCIEKDMTYLLIWWSERQTQTFVRRSKAQIRWSRSNGWSL